MCSSWGTKLHTNSYFEELEHVFDLFLLCGHVVRKNGVYFKHTVGNGSLHEINKDLEIRANLCNIKEFFFVGSLTFLFCSIYKNAFFSDGRVDVWFTDELIVILYCTSFLKICWVLFLALFQPAQPRPAHVISGKVEPIMLAPVPYEFIA